MKKLFEKTPEGEMVNNLYTISYATHCVRMSEAYKRECLWKGICIGSNLIWVLCFVFNIVAG
jgi:hypothetical protein